MSGIGEAAAIAGVIACVAQIISAYNDGSSILYKIKQKRAMKRKPPPLTLLKDSLEQSPQAIESEKQIGVRRLGTRFDRGDDIAIKALQQIKIEIKAALFEHLVEALQNDEATNFTIILDASDLGRDKTVSTLMTLRQRLMQSATIDELPLPSPLHSPHSPSDFDAYEVGELPMDSLVMTEANQTVEPAGPYRLEQTSPLKSTHKRKKSEDTNNYSPSYFPNFSLKWKKRSKSDAAQQNQPSSPQPRSSLMPGTPSSPRSSAEPGSPIPEGMLVQYPRLDAPPSAPYLYGELEDSNKIWRSNSERKDSPMVDSHRFVQNYTGDLPIPTEGNRYLGVCKGAWKLQCGSSSAFKQRLEFNDGWSSSKVPYLACSSNDCCFACRLPPDRIHAVWRSNKGVAFRWRFLAKSHVQQAKVDKERYAYQCMFCALMGKEPRVYFGTDTLTSHLAEHRGRLLPREVLHRSRCINDRVLSDDEDFDINLYPVGFGAQRPESQVLDDGLLFSGQQHWNSGADPGFETQNQWG